MAVEFEKEMRKHREKAATILKEYFGGEYPAYFKNRLTEQCCVTDLSQALFEYEHGEINQAELEIVRQKTFNHIESMRPWDEAMFHRKPGQFPEFPDVDKDRLN